MVEQSDSVLVRTQVLCESYLCYLSGTTDDGKPACKSRADLSGHPFIAVIIGAPERYRLRNQLVGEMTMTQFDFEARRKERSAAQTATLREQNEIDRKS